MARDAIDTIGNLATLGTILSAGGLTLLLASLTNTALLSTLAAPLVIALGLTAAPLIGVAIVIAALLMAATIGPVMLFYFNALHDDLALFIDDITCDLYCSTSPEQARAIFQDYTTVSIGNLIYDDAAHESMFSEIVTKVLLFFLPTGYFNLLFAGLDKVQEYIETRDEGFDCSTCACEPEEPPAGYLLQDASLITELSCPANGTMAVDGATVQFLLATTDGSDPSCVATVAHGETEWAAIVMQVIWNVGQWRGDNVPSAGLYANSATYVLGAGNLAAAEIAELSAWAAERGYEWRHATSFPPRTNASFNHRHRLDHTTGETSELLAYYRFLIPAP